MSVWLIRKVCWSRRADCSKALSFHLLKEKRRYGGWEGLCKCYKRKTWCHKKLALEAYICTNHKLCIQRFLDTFFVSFYNFSVFLVLLGKSMVWFLHDRDLHHERAKYTSDDYRNIKVISVLHKSDEIWKINWCTRITERLLISP